MHLTYLTSQERVLLWGEAPKSRTLYDALAACGSDHAANVMVPPGRRDTVKGLALSVTDAVGVLLSQPDEVIDQHPPSVQAWTLAARFTADLVRRQRVVPRMSEDGKMLWGVDLDTVPDQRRFHALASTFPPAACAEAVEGSRSGTAPVRDVILSWMDAVTTAIVRFGVEGAEEADPRWSWEARLIQALAGHITRFNPIDNEGRDIRAALRDWITPPAPPPSGTLRLALRLELPGEASLRSGDLRVSFLLQAEDDPSLLLNAQDVWAGGSWAFRRLGRAFANPEESLLAGLARCAELYKPIERILGQAQPDHLMVSPGEAISLLHDLGEALVQNNFGILLPAELTEAGRRRLKVRMRVGEKASTEWKTSGAFSLQSVVSFNWEAAIDDEALTADEIAALAKVKSPFVQLRGKWVMVRPGELAQAAALLEKGGTLSGAAALGAVLRGAIDHDDEPVSVVAGVALRDVLDRLKGASTTVTTPPPGFQGTLRPYQLRGLSWLLTLSKLGLGSVLADDMGLGKTIQLLAFLLAWRQQNPQDRRPVLLVAPTSVVGNWEREAARFAPSLSVMRYHGVSRSRNPNFGHHVVVTSYGVLRRDQEMLTSVNWASVVLDEAQNIKNAEAQTARVARMLQADHHIALTGTPVENRLSELWSLFAFAVPGLLGPQETFRREVANPIEKEGNAEAAERLKRVVSPFLLRRVKTDPAVISDLPEKIEMKEICALSREQVSLYQASVANALERIASADGIQRRGLVLALIMGLKQICNHPAQFQKEPGPLPNRSGKLDRLVEMMEEVVAVGDRALVFTQFREMGELLVNQLTEAFGEDVFFLHGGTSRVQRDRMVERFQNDPSAPHIFVLSLKAGGTGLNLTAANHVFHFDRWWNPAVEDQATDRAFRIGQTRGVQVHKLICAGTMEEKVDQLLEKKRDLAARIVGSGEAWITEMNDAELRELFSLSSDSVDDDDDTSAQGDRRRGRGKA